MIGPIDYYAILGIPRDASVADVRKAYKREEKIWRKRAAASTQKSVREEAMRRLTLLSEALSTLPDAQRRAAYDRQLIAAPGMPSSSPLPEGVSFSNWIEQAEYYLGVGDYSTAAAVAHGATEKLSNAAVSWYLLSRANAGLRRLNDAVYEARRAIELEPTNSWYYFNLGMIYEELGQWNEALSMYGEASQREPGEPLYQLAIGGVWLQNDQPAKAMPIIENIYSRLPNDEAACYYYAQALIARAESVPKDKTSEGYAVTSAQEIQEMLGYLSRASGIKLLDQETRQVILDTEAYLHRMEGHTFNIPRGALLFGSSLMSTTDGGCMSTLLMSFLVGAFFFAPLILLLWGFGMMTGGSILGGFLLLLCSIGLGYVWFRAVWVPRWKVNARLKGHPIRFLS